LFQLVRRGLRAVGWPSTGDWVKANEPERVWTTYGVLVSCDDLRRVPKALASPSTDKFFLLTRRGSAAIMIEDGDLVLVQSTEMTHGNGRAEGRWHVPAREDGPEIELDLDGVGITSR
jgi:hypothetical protein